MSQTTRPVVEVAVGIILNEHNQFLLAKRPAGKPYADYWEFPGGKLETNETVHQALVRELEEELGIQTLSSQAWQVIEHDYPHAYVRLHLHTVRHWTGLPHGLEGQALHWQSQNEDPQVEPLLPATITIIEMMESMQL